MCIARIASRLSSIRQCCVHGCGTHRNSRLGRQRINCGLAQRRHRRRHRARGGRRQRSGRLELLQRPPPIPAKAVGEACGVPHGGIGVAVGCLAPKNERRAHLGPHGQSMRCSSQRSLALGLSVGHDAARIATSRVRRRRTAKGAPAVRVRIFDGAQVRRH